MTRIVLDANVLAPAFVNTFATMEWLVAAWRVDDIELIVAEPILHLLSG